jgi:hypothetical protein
MSSVKPSLLLIACGALAREIKTLKRLGGWDHVTIRCLPSKLHNTPDEIPKAVRKQLEEAAGHFDRLFVAYADCGTGGHLDSLCVEYGVERLPGAHCYEFFAGGERFAELHDEEPGTFYLTDFLVRNFDRLVFRGLGLDRHPELLSDYFGNYRRVVYLAQSPSQELEDKARDCAKTLGLDFEIVITGLDRFDRALDIIGQRTASRESSR